MPEETAISLKNRTNKHFAKQLKRPSLITRPKIQRKNCWKAKENNDMIDTVARGWHCAPIFTISRVNDEGTEEEEILEDDVFDGAHKIEAVIKFTDDEFTLEKLHRTSPLKEFEGKKFSELPSIWKNKIYNYNFYINVIDEETANDKDSLKILWERLNKSGKPLNDYELALPVISELANNILKPSLELFYNSEIFQKGESTRGQAEKILQILLATGEGSVQDSHMREFASKKDLINRWQKVALGDKISEINEKTTANSEKWLGILKKASIYMNYLKEANCFVDNTGKNILESAHRGTELVFLLARAVHHFPNAADFSRASYDIAKHMKIKYFSTIVRDEKGRNGGLQRRLLKDIDADLAVFAAQKEPRSFSKGVIKQKMVEQNTICALCKEAILENQSHRGDHIIPWSLGGATTPENCQVTHTKCNLAKGNRV
jgi:hypothetical protein